MKSSTGQYYQSLDHIRALAVFIVFAWHFIHFNNGQLEGPLAFPLSIFTEGHTGVAIFMTLSGYLFAKLTENKKIIFYPFLWNRFLRLAPLLFFIIVIVGFQNWINGSLDPSYIKRIIKGFIYPSLPNGGWSITVELHFYILLPLLLFLSKKSSHRLLYIVTIGLVTRFIIFIVNGEVQSFAYWTIIGRLDQFVLGIYFYINRNCFKNKGYLIILILSIFLIFWYWFDENGGFYKSPYYPSPSLIWVIIPTIEGMAYGSLIAWYDTSSSYSESRVAKSIALIGTYSYSIYLFHFFIVFEIPFFIDKYLYNLTNRYILLMTAIPSFLIMIPFAHISYHYIEQPFLKFRKRYLIN